MCSTSLWSKYYLWATLRLTSLCLMNAIQDLKINNTAQIHLLYMRLKLHVGNFCSNSPCPSPCPSPFLTIFGNCWVSKSSSCLNLEKSEKLNFLSQKDWGSPQNLILLQVFLHSSYFQTLPLLLVNG